MTNNTTSRAVSAPTAARQSIDTPEFRDLLLRAQYFFSQGGANQNHAENCLIAHIDNWAARSAAEATDEQHLSSRHAAAPARQHHADDVVRLNYKIVPVYPTQAMCDAGRREAMDWQNSGEPFGAMTWFRIYKAMIGAAPAPGNTANERNS